MSSRDPRRNPHNEPYTDDTIPMHRPPATPRDRRVPPPADRQPPRPQDRRPPSPADYQPPRQPARPPVVQPQPSRRPPQVPPPPLRGKATSRGSASAGQWLRRAFLLLIAGLVLSCVGTVYFQQRIASKVKLADVRQNRPPAATLLSPMNILLLGVDLREGFPGEGVRSDSIILLHLDPRAGWGSMLSIPRDTIADVPGLGENKINTAFKYGYDNAAELFGADTDPTAGGAAVAADTVERFLNLADNNARINYVATINFNGFAQLIDAVGGVEVDVPREIVDTEYPTEDFGYMTLRIPAGRQRMNGETALQYVRTRHADSDFGRGQRQQQVIRGLVQALREQPALLRPLAAMRLVNAASDATRTTVPVGRPDALIMSALLARIDPSQLAQYRLDPEQIGVQEFGSDLVWDPAGVQATVREALSPPGEAKEQATVQVQNGVGTPGIATRLTTALAGSSFTTTDPDDAEPAEQSEIIDYGDHAATRERLSKVLGGMPVREGSSDEAPVNADIVVRLGTDYEQYWRER